MVKLFDKIKNIFLKLDKNYYLILGISLLMMAPLFSYFYINGHDIQFHLSNIIALADNIIENGFNLLPSRILPKIARNFGYGSGIFYPRLAHYAILYLAAMGKIIGFNLLTSFKLFQFLIIFISALITYNLVKKITKNDKIGIIAAIMYITCPYFLSDFYVRSAISECLILLFTPLIVSGLYDLLYLNKIKSFYLKFVIGFIGVVNSHLVMGVYLVIILIIFLLFNIKKVIQKDNIKALFISSFFIIGMSLVSIIPTIEHKLFGNYSIFIKDFMGNHDWVYGTALNISDYFSMVFNQKNMGISFYFNIIMIVMFTFTIIKRKEIIKKINNRVLYYSLLFTSLCLFIFATKLFFWYKVPQFMTLIQFPWRLETFLCFFLSIFSSLLAISWSKEKLQFYYPIIIIGLIYFGFQAIDYNRINYIGVSDISHNGMGSQKEYFPTKTLKNIDYFNNREEGIIVKEGSLDITKEISTVPSLKANISNLTGSAIIELPRLYYLGYKVYLNGKELSYKENKYGFIETKIISNGKLTLEYEGTKLDNISKIISVSTMGIFIIFIILKKKEIKYVEVN